MVFVNYSEQEDQQHKSLSAKEGIKMKIFVQCWSNNKKPRNYFLLRSSADVVAT